MKLTKVILLGVVFASCAVKKQTEQSAQLASTPETERHLVCKGTNLSSGFAVTVRIDRDPQGSVSAQITTPGLLASEAVVGLYAVVQKSNSANQIVFTDGKDPGKFTFNKSRRILVATENQTLAGRDIVSTDLTCR
ncbi:MAG: hypothetical protein NTV34_06615 [Proteobacteria bacterium]|nr:hypothetical protein [Pseudomonadota bacterium]